MFRYIPIKENLFSPDLGNYMSFGIRAFLESETSSEEVAFVSDVSVNLEFVQKLAALFTKEQLDPIHLLDVIEDSI